VEVEEEETGRVRIEKEMEKWVEKCNDKKNKKDGIKCFTFSFIYYSENYHCHKIDEVTARGQWLSRIKVHDCDHDVEEVM
jgi:hypothetical protein